MRFRTARSRWVLLEQRRAPGRPWAPARCSGITVVARGWLAAARSGEQEADQLAGLAELVLAVSGAAEARVAMTVDGGGTGHHQVHTSPALGAGALQREVSPACHRPGREITPLSACFPQGVAMISGLAELPQVAGDRL